MSPDPLKDKKIFIGFNSAGAVGIYEFTRVLKNRGYQIDFYGIGKIRFNMPVDFLLKFSPGKFRNFLERLVYFFRLLPSYDIWHLNYAEVFFFYPLNLFILKLWGKKIICTFRGADIRTGFNIPIKLPASFEERFGFWRNLKRRLRMKIFVFFADKVILTGPFLVPYVNSFDAIIPYARNIPKIKPQNHQPNNIKLVIHAPSNPAAKGTEIVSRVFQKLARQYPKIKFQIISGLNYQQLQQLLAKSDIVIDQLLVGWYGGVAVEAMALEKPVLVFINPNYLPYISYADKLPIINTNIWQLESDLEFYLNHPEICRLKGAEGYKFVKKFHHCQKIADQYQQIYLQVLK